MASIGDIFLDFESRSRAKLKDTGAWRYCEDESTTAICLAYSFNKQDPEIWIDGQPQPERLKRAIELGWNVHGWNGMSFERAMFENVMKTKYGWVVPKLEQYYDTMLDALSLALPAGLDACGDALGLDVTKDKEGKRLINFLCKPITSGKKKGEFRERENFPEEYAAMYKYCKQDVRSEIAIYDALPYHVRGQEREIALMIARINERGVPVDTSEVEAIYEGVEREKEILKAKFYMVTGVNSPTQTAKYLTWLKGKLESTTHVVDNVRAETLRDLISAGGLPPTVKLAITLTQSIKLTSTAKYPKILKQVCKDSTVKNNLIFHKANTGRLAGAGFQIQNLVGACEYEPEPLIEAFVDGDYDFINLYHGVIEVASGLIRSMIKAPYGYKFHNGDLKGVEARGSMWAAEEWEGLELIKQGHDPYRITAASMYNVVIEAVTKVQRAAGKISVLSGGFGGGYRALLDMALKMNMEMDEKTARKYNREFRAGRPKLVKKWEQFGECAIRAVVNPGTVFPVDNTKRFGFVRLGNFLYMILPNKRMLCFPYPRLKTEMFFGREVTNVSAKWVSSYTRKWEDRTITGANFFQSAVQGLCRDLLMEAHLRVEDEGLPLIMSVHDEGMSVVPDDTRYNISRYDELMCVVPDWAEGFPLDADCWEGKRFKK